MPYPLDHEDIKLFGTPPPSRTEKASLEGSRVIPYVRHILYITLLIYFFEPALYIIMNYNMGAKMKLEQKQKARQLRTDGLSIKQITKILNVSQSSVSKWVRDIELTFDQLEYLDKNNVTKNSQHLGAKARSDKARQLRLEYQKEGRKKAKEGNLLHQAGCMLYWAEGNKSKNQCTLVNTDNNLLKFFKQFLQENFNLSKKDFVITINYYTNNGLTKEDIENYWLTELDLDRSCLRKGQENNKPRSSTNSIRHNKHPYGMCCLKINNTKIVQHIYGAIQEYVGFNNNYMLM